MQELISNLLIGLGALALFLSLVGLVYLLVFISASTAKSTVCKSNSDCTDNYQCSLGVCRAPQGSTCTRDADCASGTCQQNVCMAANIMIPNPLVNTSITIGTSNNIPTDDTMIETIETLDTMTTTNIQTLDTITERTGTCLPIKKYHRHHHYHGRNNYQTSCENNSTSDNQLILDISASDYSSTETISETIVDALFMDAVSFAGARIAIDSQGRLYHGATLIDTLDFPVQQVAVWAGQLVLLSNGQLYSSTTAFTFSAMNLVSDLIINITNTPSGSYLILQSYFNLIIVASDNSILATIPYNNTLRRVYSDDLNLYADIDLNGLTLSTGKRLRRVVDAVFDTNGSLIKLSYSLAKEHSANRIRVLDQGIIYLRTFALV